MADVRRGDVLEVTAGTYLGDKFRVKGVEDWGERQKNIAPVHMYDSEVSVLRGGVTKNAMGQTSRAPTASSTGVSCSIQPRGVGQKETGWAQVGTGAFVAWFDDKAVVLEYTEEVLNVG